MATEETLLETDFETEATGEPPDGWSQYGNGNQKVVATTAGSGSKSFRMKGSPGGCWEAISHHELDLPNSGTTRFSGKVKPTTEGEMGCHENKRGRIMLRTGGQGTYPGEGTQLVTFRPDGTVAASGETFGSYEVDAWNDFDIRYERPSSDDTVTLSFEINGEERGSLERGVTDFEDDLSHISLQSGDFTIYWDDFGVSEESESETTLLDTTFEDTSSGSYPEGWVKNGNEDQQVIDNVAAEGEQSLELRGRPGGCWEAIANHAVSIPDDETYRVAGSVRPTDDGEVGCHQKRRGLIKLRTRNESWSTGESVTLLRPKMDGSLVGRGGLELGEYTAGEWLSFDVTVTPDGGEVTLEYTIDGSVAGETTVEAADFESDLSHIGLYSGDFVVQWDDLSVVRLGDGGDDDTSNQPPQPSFSYEPEGDGAVTPGKSVTFRSTATDDGRIERYRWDFTDDGTFDAEGSTATHTFDEAGNYSVTHRVVDDDGASAETRRTVTVEQVVTVTPTSPTPTPTETPTERPDTPDSTTQPPTTVADVPYDLSNARPKRRVTVAGTDYLLLWQIPDTSDLRVAVVDPAGRELVSPREAYDAILTDAWTGKPYPYDWNEQIQIAQQKRSDAKFYETANNIGNLAVDALATYAMAQVNPAAGVGPALNLLEDSLNWTTDDYDGDAYREGMTKLHRYAKNAGVVEDRLRDIDRADSLPEEAVEVVSTGEDIYGKLDDITHVAKTTVATYKSSGLYSSAATAGGAAAGSALFYFAVGELVAAGVDTITTGFKQNAKLAAANHAYNSMRLPVLHELADLKERARNGRLSPGQIVRMHLLEQQHFNVCKIGNATMHKIVMGLNQSVLGGVWDVLVDSTEAQSVLRERRDRHELAAAASHAELGEWWARSDDTFAESVNREVYGDV